MKNLLCLWAAASSLALQAAGFAIDPSFGRANVIEHPDPVKRQELQDIVCICLRKKRKRSFLILQDVEVNG